MHLESRFDLLNIGIPWAFRQATNRYWCACQGWATAQTNFRKDIYANRRAAIEASTFEQLVEDIRSEARDMKPARVTVKMIISH